MSYKKNTQKLFAKEYMSYSNIFLLMTIPIVLIIVVIQLLNFKKHRKAIEKLHKHLSINSI